MFDTRPGDKEQGWDGDTPPADGSGSFNIDATSENDWTVLQIGGYWWVLWTRSCQRGGVQSASVKSQ